VINTVSRVRVNTKCFAHCGSGMFGETSSLLDGHIDKCTTTVRSYKLDTITCFRNSSDKNVEGVVHHVRKVLRLLHARLIGKGHCGDVCSDLQHLQVI
jgi:hypothetical protein